MRLAIALSGDVAQLPCRHQTLQFGLNGPDFPLGPEVGHRQVALRAKLGDLLRGQAHWLVPFLTFRQYGPENAPARTFINSAGTLVVLQTTGRSEYAK